MNTEAPFDYAVDLYKVSQHPEFGAVYELLRRIASDHYAPMPRTAEDKIAYETSCWVSTTIRTIMAKLSEEIEVGRRLSGDDDGGEQNDSAETGYRRRC